jgi:hypothetical protein
VLPLLARQGFFLNFCRAAVFALRLSRSILPTTVTPGKPPSASAAGSGCGFGFSTGGGRKLTGVFYQNFFVLKFLRTIVLEWFCRVQATKPGSSRRILPMLICLASSLIILSAANSFSKGEYISLSSL